PRVSTVALTSCDFSLWDIVSDRESNTSVSFSRPPFSRPCESSLCSIFCHDPIRFFFHRDRSYSRWPRRGVPLLSSTCLAFRNLLQYAPLFVFVCWYILICFLAP